MPILLNGILSLIDFIPNNPTTCFQPCSDSLSRLSLNCLIPFIGKAHIAYIPKGGRVTGLSKLARVVDRGIRHTDCVDYRKLCIKEGEYVYVLFIDCYMMDYYGNLTDAAAIAAITALLNAKLPRAKLDANGKPEWDGTYMPVPINEIPLSVTFGRVGDVIFVDPNLSEELVLDGSVAFAIDEKKQITSIQKYGSAPWSVKEILETGQKAVKIADDLRAKLNLRQYIPKFD